MREVVAVAASHAEEQAIERVLEEAGVAYETRVDALEGSSSVCFLGCGYAVDAKVADAARERLRQAGVPVVDS